MKRFIEKLQKKLPSKTIIAPEKLKEYLLLPKKRNDKSKWLAQAGYKLENWQVLESDLRTQILSHKARPVDVTHYGQMYEIRGQLVGPNGTALNCSERLYDLDKQKRNQGNQVYYNVSRQKEMMNNEI